VNNQSSALLKRETVEIQGGLVKRITGIIAVLIVMIVGSATPSDRADAQRRGESELVARWDLQSSGVDDDLTGVFFIDSERGWAIGKNNTIIATRDGGKNWRRLMERDEHGQSFEDVVFTSKTDGWVGCRGTLLHTTDGGESWIPASTLRRTQDFGFGSGSSVGSIRFQLATLNTGVGVHRSDDGGKRWQRVGDLPRNGYQDIFFVDPQHGWVIGNYATQSIGYTTDGGKTWGFADETVQESISNKIRFANPTTGWAFASSGSVILASTDGGKTWNNQATTLQSYRTSVDISVLNEREVFIASSESVIHTTDGGKIWRVIGKFPSSTVSALSFPDSSHGWVVGRKGYISHFHLVGAGSQSAR
jgi:photosystem II stability/assembly factor-like uncharacterized protein